MAQTVVHMTIIRAIVAVPADNGLETGRIGRITGEDRYIRTKGKKRKERHP